MPSREQILEEQLGAARGLLHTAKLQLKDTQDALKDAVGIPAFMREVMYKPPAMTIKPEAAAVLDRAEVHLKVIQEVLGKRHPTDLITVVCCKSICCETGDRCLCYSNARCVICKLCERHCECSLHDSAK